MKNIALCARCNADVGPFKRNCHQCEAPLCDHTCEEWHLEKDCGKNPHAVALGRLGGKANKGITKPKSAENGKKGGRPKLICGRCLKSHSKKQLNICDDGIASGDQRDYPIL